MNSRTMDELIDMLNGLRERSTYWKKGASQSKGKPPAAEAYADGAAMAYDTAISALEEILVADADRREAAGESADETLQCEKCGASQ